MKKEDEIESPLINRTLTSLKNIIDEKEDEKPLLRKILFVLMQTENEIALARQFDKLNREKKVERRIEDLHEYFQ